MGILRLLRSDKAANTSAALTILILRVDSAPRVVDLLEPDPLESPGKSLHRRDALARTPQRLEGIFEPIREEVMTPEEVTAERLAVQLLSPFNWA